MAIILHVSTHFFRLCHQQYGTWLRINVDRLCKQHGTMIRCNLKFLNLRISAFPLMYMCSNATHTIYIFFFRTQTLKMTCFSIIEPRYGKPKWKWKHAGKMAYRHIDARTEQEVREKKGQKRNEEVNFSSQTSKLIKQKEKSVENFNSSRHYRVLVTLKS